MDKEFLWNDVMTSLTALKRMEGYDCKKCAIKERERRIASLKSRVVCHISTLYKNNEISKKFDSYEEILNSLEIHEWLVSNAPNGFEVGKSDIFTNEKALNHRKLVEREFKLYGDKIPIMYLKRYMRSCGYETVEEVSTKDLAIIAKKHNVATYVVKEKIKEYFNLPQIKKESQAAYRERK